MSQQAPASSHDASNPAGHNMYNFNSLADGAVQVCAYCHFDHPIDLNCVTAMLDGALPRLDFEPTQPDIDHFTEEEWARMMFTMEQEASANIAQQNATSERTYGDVDAREENPSPNSGGSASNTGFEYNQPQADVSPLRATAYTSGRYATPRSDNNFSDSYSSRDPRLSFTPPLHRNAIDSMSAAPGTAPNPRPPAVELTGSNLEPRTFKNTSVLPEVGKTGVPAVEDAASRPSVHGDPQFIDSTVEAPMGSRDDSGPLSHQGVQKQHHATFQDINESQMPSAAPMNQAEPANILSITAVTFMRTSPGLSQMLSKRAGKQKVQSKPATAKAHAKARSAASATSVQAPSNASPPTDTQPTSSPDAPTAPDGASDSSNDFFDSIEDAEDWFRANREPLVKLNIPQDDYQSLQEVDIMARARQIESVLLDKHDPPKSEWNAKIKKYFERNQANSLGTLRELRGTPAGIKKVQYHCIKAAQSIYDVHDKGVPKSHVDKGKGSKPAGGYYSDLELTCGARFLTVESVVKGNKSIAKRLAQGDFVHVVGNPPDCLQRELTNVYINGNRELKKKEEIEAEEQARAAGTAAKATTTTAQQAVQAPKKPRAKSKKRDTDNSDEPEPKRRKRNKTTTGGETSVEQAKAAASSGHTAGDNVDSAAPSPIAHHSYPVPDSMAPAPTMIARPKQGAKRKQLEVTNDEAERDWAMEEGIQQQRAAGHTRLMEAGRNTLQDTRESSDPGSRGGNILPATRPNHVRRHQMDSSAAISFRPHVPSASMQMGFQANPMIGSHYSNQLPNYAAGSDGPGQDIPMNVGQNHSAFGGQSTAYSTIQSPIPAPWRRIAQPMDYMQSAHSQGQSTAPYAMPPGPADNQPASQGDYRNEYGQNQYPDYRAGYEDEGDL